MPQVIRAGGKRRHDQFRGQRDEVGSQPDLGVAEELTTCRLTDGIAAHPVRSTPAVFGELAVGSVQLRRVGGLSTCRPA
jgi:hypothetical protein